jgi:hypothetical protein
MSLDRCGGGPGLRSAVPLLLSRFLLLWLLLLLLLLLSHRPGCSLPPGLVPRPAAPRPLLLEAPRPP